MKIAPVFIFVCMLISHMQAQTTFYVDKVEDLYKVIGSNRTIVLKPGDYHLEKIDSTLKNQACNWSLVLLDEIYENETQEKDKTLLISGLENLTIKAETGRKDSVRILTNRRSASVMAFRSCTNLKVEGIIFGHDIVKYTDPADSWVSFCSGEVLEFFDCNKITLKSNILFGCGTRGFLVHRCKDITLEKTIIRDCSYGLFGVFDCENILFKKCNFYFSMYTTLFEIAGSKNLTAKKTAIHSCMFSGFGESEVKMESSENIHLEQIKIKMMSKKEFFNMGDDPGNNKP